MKKKLAIASLAIVAITGGTYGIISSSHPQHLSQFVLSAENHMRAAEVIEGEQDGKKGVTFAMELCVPMPAPAKCEVRKYGLFVPYGKEAFGMPYSQRPVDIETVEEARLEAEVRADTIENVKK